MGGLKEGMVSVLILFFAFSLSTGSTRTVARWGCPVAFHIDLLEMNGNFPLLTDTMILPLQG